MVAATTRTSTGIESRSAEPRDLSLLEDAEQLDLCGRWDFSDFVQEKRATVGQLEAPEPTFRRARERALFVAEELTFE